MLNSAVAAASLRAWFDAGLALLFPEVCQLCGQTRATPRQCYVCAGCRARVRWVEPPVCERCGRPFEGAITTSFVCGHCQETKLHFSSARSAVLADDFALDVIHRYKYGRALWFEPLLADWLVARARPALEAGSWDCIVPIPLHPAKQREREFNQAERLATRLSDATGIPLNKCLVRRVLPTRTQTRLTREERLANVRRAFACPGSSRLKGERLILVDDVLTTGATASACAGALWQAGAGDVCVWTVARGI